MDHGVLMCVMAHGESLPKENEMPSRTDPQMRVRVTPEIKDWLDRKAKSEQRSIAFIVQQSLEKAKKLEEMSQ